VRSDHEDTHSVNRGLIAPEEVLGDPFLSRRALAQLKRAAQGRLGGDLVSQMGQVPIITETFPGTLSGIGRRLYEVYSAAAHVGERHHGGSIIQHVRAWLAYPVTDTGRDIVFI